MDQKQQDREWAGMILGYAKEMWGHEGWDIVYETMGKDEVVTEFEEARAEGREVSTYQEAFDRIDWLRGLWYEQQQEVQATIF